MQSEVSGSRSQWPVSTHLARSLRCGRRACRDQQQLARGRRTGSRGQSILSLSAVPLSAISRPVLAVTAGILALVLWLIFLKRIRSAQFGWRANALALLGLP